MAASRGPAESTRKSSERLPPEDVLEYVQLRLRFGRTPDEIGSETETLYKEGALSAHVTGRTVRNWIASGKAPRPPRPSDPWSLLNGRPEELALVVPFMAFFASLPRSVRWLSIREAEVIARVRRAAADLPEIQTITIALTYAERERAGKPTSDLDLFLGFGPWRRKEGESDDWRQQREAFYFRLARRAGLPGIHVDPDEPGRLLYVRASVFEIQWRPIEQTNEQPPHGQEE